MEDEDDSPTTKLKKIEKGIRMDIKRAEKPGKFIRKEVENKRNESTKRRKFKLANKANTGSGWNKRVSEDDGVLVEVPIWSNEG